MSIREILSDPTSFKMALLSIAAILAVLFYLAYRLRGDGPKVKVKSTPGPILLKLDNATPTRGETIPKAAFESTPQIIEPPAPPPVESIPQVIVPLAPPPAVSTPRVVEPPAPHHIESTPQVIAPPAPPTFATLAGRTSVLNDIMRGALVILALVVAAGFVLIILPQNTFERIAQSVQSRSSAAPLQEKIAFLYLGDELKDNQFNIRGAVRNIVTEPIEKMDAVIRLYAAGGDLLETTVVRMDKESIAPDEVAQFHLAYPDYQGQFGSYSVEFKMRQGEIVPYKDMRAPRGHN